MYARQALITTRNVMADTHLNVSVYETLSGHRLRFEEYEKSASSIMSTKFTARNTYKIVGECMCIIFQRTAFLANGFSVNCQGEWPTVVNV